MGQFAGRADDAEFGAVQRAVPADRFENRGDVPPALGLEVQLGQESLGLVASSSRQERGDEGDAGIAPFVRRLFPGVLEGPQGPGKPLLFAGQFLLEPENQPRGQRAFAGTSARDPLGCKPQALASHRAPLGAPEIGAGIREPVSAAGAAAVGLVAEDLDRPAARRTRRFDSRVLMPEAAVLPGALHGFLRDLTTTREGELDFGNINRQYRPG